MTDLQKLQAWLKTFPKWEEGKMLYVDFADAVPGNMGLFPKGLEEISRREDVLGNVQLRQRYHFALYRVASGQESQEENAAWLLEFQNWVQQQDMLGLSPRFGDIPQQEHIRAENGKFSNRRQVGSAIYVVTLTADFTKIYEVN